MTRSVHTRIRDAKNVQGTEERSSLQNGRRTVGGGVAAAPSGCGVKPGPALRTDLGVIEHLVTG